MKVVMVDDSNTDRKLCRVLLRKTLGEQLQFWEASAGEAGLEACRALAPDCILLDYTLPDMTGIEFVSRLRSNDPLSALGAAVVMLGLDNDRVAVQALKAGAQDYLVKDRISSEVLLRAIEEALEKAVAIRGLKEERDRLMRALAQQEVLLKEVHHRVKNNLQVIASLLRMEANAREDPVLQEAFRESQNRIESMALIHEQLYENREQMYENEHLREVDLAKHAAQLLANLFDSYGVDPARISGLVEIPPLPIRVDRAIPAGLILNELISNALRHAFPGDRKGMIRVEGRSDGGHVTLAVRDDGAGPPENFEPRRTASLGLKIVDVLTSQLKGTFALDRTGGTTFRISFPEV